MSTCAACGISTSLEAHHVTGRAGPGLGYLDAAFTVDLCKACHDREHVAVRRAGLAWPTERFLSYRLARVANLVSRLVDIGQLPNWLAPLTGLLSDAAEALADEPDGAAL